MLSGTERSEVQSKHLQPQRQVAGNAVSIPNERFFALLSMTRLWQATRQLPAPPVSVRIGHDLSAYAQVARRNAAVSSRLAVCGGVCIRLAASDHFPTIDESPGIVRMVGKFLTCCAV